MTTETTLAEARETVSAARDEGIVCPCCDQFVRVYKRKITHAMAEGLIKVFHESRHEECYIPDVLSERESADFAKLRYWGLIVPVPHPREDGSMRNGCWQVTFRGAAWIKNVNVVPKFKYVFNSEVIGSEGPNVSIVDTVGHGFRYDELMAGV